MNKESREKVWRKYGGRCAYCGEKIEYKKMQVDHIIAKSLGGVNEIVNYNPSCKPCNFYKSSFTIDGFRKQINFLSERINKIFIVRLALKYKILKFKPFDGKFYFEKQ